MPESIAWCGIGYHCISEDWNAYLLPAGIDDLPAVHQYHPKRQAVYRPDFFHLCCSSSGAVSTLWSPLLNVSLFQIISFAAVVVLAANVALHWKGPPDTSRVFFHRVCVLLLVSGVILSAYFLFP